MKSKTRFGALLIIALLIAISIPVMAFAANTYTVNDFSFKINSTIKDDILTVNVDTTVPQGLPNKRNIICVNFYADDQLLGKETNVTLKEDGTERQWNDRVVQLGDVSYCSAASTPSVVLHFCGLDVAEPVEAGEYHFVLTFDVSEIKITDETQIKMIPCQNITRNLYYAFQWNGSVSYIDNYDGTPLATCYLNSMPVNEDTSSITADTSSIGEVYEGKTFTVPVKITDNPGFTACILEADYDKDALELTSITNGDVATSLAANDIATGTANITSDSSITKESGTLFNYTFKVKEGAAPGDYDITMKYRNDDTGNFCNGEDDVPATFVKGTVKVVEKPEVIPADSQTTVWLSTDTATVNPDGTFNVDVFMKSDQLLASGQVDLEYNPAVATIQSITVNSPQGVNNGESTYDNEAGTAKISFYGDNLNASGDAGLKVATIQMNALTAGTSDMKIISAEASPKGSDGNSLDQTVTISEEAAEVTVEVVEPSGFRVIPYVNGHRYLVMYEPSVAITEGVPTYLGQDMFWSEQYSFEANGTKGVWVCLTDKDVSLELKESDFGRNAEGTKSTVCYPASAVEGYLAGDVSGNGKVNIIDAQAAYDLSNRVYSTYDPIDMLHWLMADVNGNSLLEASDAQAIQYYIHYNTFALPAEG